MKTFPIQKQTLDRKGNVVGTDEVKAQWTKALSERGIPVDGRHEDEKGGAK